MRLFFLQLFTDTSLWVRQSFFKAVFAHGNVASILKTTHNVNRWCACTFQSMILCFCFWVSASRKCDFGCEGKLTLFSFSAVFNQGICSSWPATQRGKGLDLFSTLHGRLFYEQGSVRHSLYRETEAKSQSCSNNKRARVRTASSESNCFKCLSSVGIRHFEWNLEKTSQRKGS